MKSIDAFYQGEGVREIDHIEIASGHDFAALKARLIEKHALAADVFIFLEDADDPIDEVLIVAEHAGPAGVKAHVHRCRHIETSVTFNNETVRHKFGPGTTVAKVKHWAAVEKFKMTEAEAGEHVLQIAGTHDRPAPGTHLGSLVNCPHCRIEFYLVPDQRVNGNAAGGER